jgi:hypothetical protein
MPNGNGCGNGWRTASMIISAVALLFGILWGVQVFASGQRVDKEKVAQLEAKVGTMKDDHEKIAELERTVVQMDKNITRILVLVEMHLEQTGPALPKTRTNAREGG